MENNWGGVTGNDLYLRERCMSFLHVAASISRTYFAHGIIPMGKFKFFFSRRIRTTDRVYWIALSFAAPSYLADQEPEAMPRLPPTEIVYTLSLTPAPYVRCNTLDSRPVVRQTVQAQETPPSTGNWRIIQSNSLEMQRRRSTSSASTSSARRSNGLTR